MSSNLRLQRICQRCGNEFIAKTTVTKFCGDHCAKRAYKEKKREEKIGHSQNETEDIKYKAVHALKEKEFLSVEECCSLIGISRTTLWRLEKKSLIHIKKIGNRKIIKRSEIDRLFSL